MDADTVEQRLDRKRGCGWRKPGGLYLVADGLSRPCGKLPIPLDVCPVCGGGIKPARGWTWVNGTALAAGQTCRELGCSVCPLGSPAGIGRCGLLWVGGAFYRRPADFLAEAAEMGVSRRVPAVPKGLEVGKTWVMVAHRRAIINADGSFTAAVFGIFRPQAVEYVIREDDSTEKLERMVQRGITPVRIERVADEPLLGAAKNQQERTQNVPDTKRDGCLRRRG